MDAEGILTPAFSYYEMPNLFPLAIADFIQKKQTKPLIDYAVYLPH